MEPKIPLAQKLDWGDATFFGFVWENDGMDLRLLLSHASLPISALLCRWASDLKIDLTWRRVAASGNQAATPRGGPLLSSEGRVTRTQAGRWWISMEFGSDGELQFECEEIVAVAKGAV
jgi:hypothetical protein